MADRAPSRRDLLKLAGTAAAAASAAGASVPAAAAQRARHASRAARASRSKALTAHEADMLERIAERLIPTDATRPGRHRSAGRALHRPRARGRAGARRAGLPAGLAALDRYSRMTRGAPFVELAETDQISVLIDVESGSATGVRRRLRRQLGAVLRAWC